MAIYITGLVMITAAVELILALVVASRSSVPAASSLFWPVYFSVLIALVVAGAVLIVRGLGALRREPISSEPSTG
jgi:hypothetical protein